MADQTPIEWTDATWNPVRGCSRISPGCGGPNHQGGCYAEKIAARFSGPGQPFEGFAERGAYGGRWTGKMALVDDMLTLPLRWKKPRRIFVNSMSDLFHENLPDEAIDKVFAVMALAPQHTFQVLTKRADRMRAYMTGQTLPKVHPHWGYRRDAIHAFLCSRDDIFGGPFDHLVSCRARIGNGGWPLPNVWLGVSAEDQSRADERVPELLATPAAKRFISAEPLLGPLDLWNGDPDPRLGGHQATKTFLGEWWERGDDPKGPPRFGVDWVIVGGESGSGARSMHPNWVRSLRDQCDVAEVPFFFKQWGEYLPVGQCLPGYGKIHGATAVKPGRMKLHYGGTPQQPPKHAFADRGVEGTSSADGRLAFRVGKKAAGALLDGREHREFPT